MSKSVLLVRMVELEHRTAAKGSKKEISIFNIF